MDIEGKELNQHCELKMELYKYVTHTPLFLLFGKMTSLQYPSNYFVMYLDIEILENLVEIFVCSIGSWIMNN